MPRNNKGTRKRRHDTRLTPEQIMRILDLTPRQKITMLRFMREKMKGGGQ